MNENNKFLINYKKKKKKTTANLILYIYLITHQ